MRLLKVVRYPASSNKSGPALNARIRFSGIDECALLSRQFRKRRILDPGLFNEATVAPRHPVVKLTFLDFG